MAPPVASGVPPPTVSDPHVERLRAMQLQTWQLAYCRDVVKSVAPSTIKSVRLAPGTIMIGRAYTVSGPEIYLDALEGIVWVATLPERQPGVQRWPPSWRNVKQPDPLPPYCRPAPHSSAISCATYSPEYLT